MVDFIRRRLQVFVSSTYQDLKIERQSAVEAILSAGHIPAGMELFTAGDESQMEVIKQWIDESDVYLLILGGRYGSIDPDSGKSYTHLEYEYALASGMPVFACVINEDAIDRKVHDHGKDMIETDNAKELKLFRELVLSKISKFWSDSKDIKIVVTETLSHLARREDLVGWVRPSEQADIPALADEIARLSKENSALRSHIGNNHVTVINGITYSDMKAILAMNNALNCFLRHRVDFTGKGVHESEFLFDTDLEQTISILKEKCLVSESMFGQPSRITPEGRLFLNAYDAEQARQNDLTEN